MSTLSSLDAAYSAAQELAYSCHLVIDAAGGCGLTSKLPDGRTVPSGSDHLAQLARNVHLEAGRATRAQLILDSADDILAANLSRDDYRIGDVVAATAHEAVLTYAQGIVNLAWNWHVERMRVGAASEPQGDGTDWPTTWAADVWPHVRAELAALPPLDWPTVRLALRRERTAAVARKAGEPPDAAAQTPPENAAPPAGSSAPARKRSTQRGEGRGKLIAALSLHHQYANGSCLNYDPIGNNDLARQAEVAESTASAFFEKAFQGHDQYRALCRKKSELVAALKMLNGDYSPHILYGGSPPGESCPDDH